MSGTYRRNSLMVVFLSVLSSLIIGTVILGEGAEGFCGGFMCSITPYTAKRCCGKHQKCCHLYRQWLMPLIATGELDLPIGPIASGFPIMMGGVDSYPLADPLPAARPLYGGGLIGNRHHHYYDGFDGFNQNRLFIA